MTLSIDTSSIYPLVLYSPTRNVVCRVNNLATAHCTGKACHQEWIPGEKNGTVNIPASVSLHAGV
jgi:hypothetical protein